MENNIEVEIFDEELQDEIRAANKEFLANALIRAETVAIQKEVMLTPLEKQAPDAEIKDLSEEALQLYISKAKLPYKYNSDEFHAFLQRQGLFIRNDQSNTIKPTGLGLLLFGARPRLTYPQVVIKAEIRHRNAEPQIKDFEEPLVLLPEKIESWLSKMII